MSASPRGVRHFAATLRCLTARVCIPAWWSSTRRSASTTTSATSPGDSRARGTRRSPSICSPVTAARSAWRNSWDRCSPVASLHRSRTSCAAMDYLVALPDVDPERVGAIGFCMGGGFAIAWGRRDRRLRAIAPFLRHQSAAARGGAPHVSGGWQLPGQGLHRAVRAQARRPACRRSVSRATSRSTRARATHSSMTPARRTTPTQLPMRGAARSTSSRSTCSHRGHPMTEPIDVRERMGLCDLFVELGPDAPTLCEGWTTADLAAHLVLREHFHRWSDAKLAAEKAKGISRVGRASARRRTVDSRGASRGFATSSTGWNTSSTTRTCAAPTVVSHARRWPILKQSSWRHDRLQRQADRASASAPIGLELVRPGRREAAFGSGEMADAHRTGDGARSSTWAAGVPRRT